MPTSEYETVRIEQVPKNCPMCEDYARHNAAKSVVVMCCEGACLRGEVARRASNLLCHRLAPESTVRLCLGGAFTKDTGQRALVRNAGRVIAVEGCFLECATRMMKGVVPDLAAEVVIADRLYEFDRELFGIDEMPEEEIRRHATEVAKSLLDRVAVRGSRTGS
jgi:uncharacterized metal-binding protein